MYDIVYVVCIVLCQRDDVRYTNISYGTIREYVSIASDRERAAAGLNHNKILGNILVAKEAKICEHNFRM